jgi:hypothetical protein
LRSTLGSVNSACSCPGSDHPGPVVTQGRGSPEIDIFEAEKDKANPTGQVASQSAQFSPFSHDYTHLNDTLDEWNIFDPTMTVPNTYHGSAVYVIFLLLLCLCCCVERTLRVVGNRLYYLSQNFDQICFKVLPINDCL